MEVANTLAYYYTATITAVKKIILQVPGLHFYEINKETSNDKMTK
jgi:hypothetical protein